MNETVESGDDIVRGKFITEIKRKKTDFTRIMFIDQYRGLVILILILNLASGPFEELVPRFFVHGNNNILDAWLNPVISIIDLGAAIFGFITGLGMCISFSRRLETHGAKNAWMRILKRVIWFIILPLILVSVEAATGSYGVDDGNFLIGEFVWDWLADNIFIQVLIAGLGSVMAIQIFPKDPDKRFKFLAIPLWAFVAAMHFIPVVRDWNDNINGEAFPFPGYIAYLVYGIIGSCLWDWLNVWERDMNNPWNEPFEAMRKRIFPFMAGCVVFIFMFGFMQYPSHKGNSATMMGLILWAATGLFAIFYLMVEKVKFSITYLNWLGRNPLICYIGILLWNFIVADMIIGIDAGDLLALDTQLLGGVYSLNQIPISIANICALGLILLPLVVLSVLCYLLYKKDVKISG